jgi:tRNA-2-methylthio-N6-dimethylallyladenosine synthase
LTRKLVKGEFARGMVTRTYEVRTHGCQMNVHDSARIAGLLDGRATPRSRTARSRTSSCSAPAPCARTPTTKLDGNLGHLKPVKDRTPGMQIAVGLRRMFSALAGMPLSEYVRRGRMTVAAPEVVTGIGTCSASPCATATARQRHSAGRSSPYTASARANAWQSSSTR